MRNLIALFLLAFALSFSAGAQTSPKQGTTLVAKASAQTEQSMTKTATKTGEIYQGLPVYKSAKGALFVIVVSKKSGNPYKKYLVRR